MSSSHAKPPSLYWRVLQSIALLAGFYVMTLVVAAVLFVAPFGLFLREHHDVREYVLAFALCWIPAGLLAKGALGARRPGFDPPSNAVERSQAPELFAILDELAASAATAAPDEVYLSPGPDVGVAEVGGTFGIGSRRVLMLGVPVLECLTVQELRAVLAHELGHYVGGDTRLTGIVSYAHASFHSVFESVRQRPTHAPRHVLIAAGAEVAERIGTILVSSYVRFFLRMTRPTSRRQEAAADLLAARLCGRDAIVRALEKVSVVGPLYEAYLRADVLLAIQHGAVPSDLLAGFQRFRTRVYERGMEAQLVAMVRAEETDPFDRHPSLTERTRALIEAPDGPTQDDARSALDLVDDHDDLGRWLARATDNHLSGDRLRGGQIRLVPWSKIPDELYAPAIRKTASELTTALRLLYPKPKSIRRMFRAVVRAIAQDAGPKIALHLEPRLAHTLGPTQAAVGKIVVGRTLILLFHGALLERGATIDPSLGEACLVFRLGDERVEPEALVAAAMEHAEGAAALTSWAERLSVVEREHDESVETAAVDGGAA